HTYDENSVIDPTAEALFSRINNNILNIEKSVIETQAHYFFGSDVQNPEDCRLNFFNSRNDFEYITVVYKGFGQNCSELIDYNSEIVNVLKLSVENLIKYTIENLIS